METTRFDAAALLNTAERRAAYVAAALETGDVDEIRDALAIVARARGMAAVADHAGLSRPSLYKTLGVSGNPEFGTVVRVLAAVGIRLTAVAADQPRTRRTGNAKTGGRRIKGHARKAARVA